MVSSRQSNGITMAQIRILGMGCQPTTASRCKLLLFPKILLEFLRNNDQLSCNSPQVFTSWIFGWCPVFLFTAAWQLAVVDHAGVEGANGWAAPIAQLRQRRFLGFRTGNSSTSAHLLFFLQFQPGRKCPNNCRKRAMSAMFLSFFPICAKELWTVWGSTWDYYGLLTMVYWHVWGICFVRLLVAHLPRPKAQTAPPLRDWQRTWWGKNNAKNKPKEQLNQTWSSELATLPFLCPFSIYSACVKACEVLNHLIHQPAAWLHSLIFCLHCWCVRHGGSMYVLLRRRWASATSATSASSKMTRSFGSRALPFHCHHCSKQTADRIRLIRLIRLIRFSKKKLV